MPVVNIKGVGKAKFPDDMKINDIRTFLRKKYSPELSRQDALTPRAPTIQASNPSLATRAATAIGEGLNSTGIISDRFGAQQIGKNVTSIGEFLPGIGDAAAGDEFGRALKQGNFGDAAIAGAGAIPLIGDMAIFAGVLAKTANLGELAKAQKLESGGAGRDEVWKETGWFNDKGDWKFEIDDSEFLLDPSKPQLGEFGFKVAKGDVIKHGQLKDAYPEMLKNMTVSFEPELRSSGSYSGISASKILDLPAEHFLRLKDPAKAVGNITEKMKGWVGKIGEWTKAGYAEQYAKDFDMPLAEAKEEIAEDIGILTESMKKAREYKGEIEFYKGTGSTALHEIQHGVQKTEGFSGGGNPEMFADDYNKSLHNKNYNESESTNARLAVRKTPDYKVLQSKIDTLLSNNDMEAVRPLINQRREMENAAAKPFDDEVIAISKRLKFNPHEQYRRIAGEAEARNVQKRMDLTTQQRRDNPPWKTLDVPEDELTYPNKKDKRPTK
jgi:hypothetical protein